MSKEKYTTLDEVVAQEQQKGNEQENPEDPGEFEVLLQKHVQAVVDSVMKEGLTGLSMVVEDAMNAGLTWQEEKNKFDEFLRSKAKPVVKKKVVVRKKKATKKKKR